MQIVHDTRLGRIGYAAPLSNSALDDEVLALALGLPSTVVGPHITYPYVTQMALVAPEFLGCVAFCIVGPATVLYRCSRFVG